MSEKNNGSNLAGGGISFTGILTIVFIVLKLIGKINWSWLWVLSPLWIPIAVCVVVGLNILIWTIIAMSRGNH